MDNEGALILFTLLCQLVAGSMLFYSVFYFIGKNEISRLSKGPVIKTPELLLLIGLLMAVITSFLHPGNPGNATNALNNVGTSWLSREILSLILFSFSLLLLFFGRWLMWERRGLVSVLFLLSAFSGIILIISMIKLYMIPTVITWATWYTPVSFVLTTLILGICGVMFYALIIDWKGVIPKPVVQLLIVFLFAEAIFFILHQNTLSKINLPHDNHFLMENTHVKYAVIRVAVILSTLILFQVFLYGRKWMMESRFPIKTLLAIALILVLFEQLIGKYMFYAGYVRLGL